MSRYFNILFIFVVIKTSYCYEYVRNNEGKEQGERLRTYGGLQRQKPNHEFRSIPNAHPEYEVIDDKEPLAQIDVASFIQKADEYAVDNNSPYNMEKEMGLDHFNEYSSLDENNINGDMKKADDKYLNLDDLTQTANDLLSHKNLLKMRQLGNDPFALYLPESNRKSFNDGSSFKNKYADSSNKNLMHKPQKKCCLSNFKIPFFSHNKNNTRKAKKEKKRKIFCFKCSKKDNKGNATTQNVYDILKDRTKKEKCYKQDDLASNLKSVESLPNSMKHVRIKRDHWMKAIEKKLKELSEIQKKVDNVQISSPVQKNL